MESRSLAPNARAVVFAAVCTFLAVAAHRLMSATSIPFAAEVFGAAAVFCFARIAAALGERGLASIGLLVGGSQIGLHLLFEAVQAAAAQTVSGSMSGSMSGPMPGALLGSFPGSMAGMSDMPVMADTGSGVTAHASVSGMTSGMTIAHIIAAAVAAWWLRRGEAALFAVVERTRAVVGASWRLVVWWLVGTRPVCAAPPAFSPIGGAARPPAVARALQFTVIRRGPPAAVCR